MLCGMAEQNARRNALACRIDDPNGVCDVRLWVRNGRTRHSRHSPRIPVIYNSISKTERGSLVGGSILGLLWYREVQRLWPETLIDMAAGEMHSQVIVKHKNNDGLCLLNALSIPPDEKDWAERLAAATGLEPLLIANNPTGAITQAEVDAAPADKKAELQKAIGKPRCGHINRQSLEMEGYDPHFAPAVPFVTASSGIKGAAETIKWLMGHRYPHSLHFSIISNQAAPEHWT